MRLRAARIGVIGLSAGFSCALTLALEGIGKEFRLADFDTMSLSNMNRVPASVADIGLSKCVIIARRMFEIDPYLEVSILPRGVREDSVDDFLLREERLDLLVEECDDLVIKVLARERARAHRIPVITETNDRGMVDIERFDLDPERPILHGLLA